MDNELFSSYADGGKIHLHYLFIILDLFRYAEEHNKRFELKNIYDDADTIAAVLARDHAVDADALAIEIVADLLPYYESHVRARKSSASN